MIVEDISDKLRNASLEALLVIDRNELANWQRHPATHALLKIVQHEYLTYYVEWGAGYRTKDTFDGTMQENSKALGAVEALEKVEEYITDMFSLREEAEAEVEDDSTEGP